MICQCGTSYGIRKGTSRSCIRCGSIKSRIVSEFHTSAELASAVSLANMPPEIAKEIQSKISKKDELSTTNVDSDLSTSKFLRAMKDATNEDGILEGSVLQRILDERNIVDPSAEYLIGQAELEGIIIRISPKSWSWL